MEGERLLSSGAFACKRDVIPFEKWIEAELWGKKTPGLFGDFYEQPILNYLVHSMTQRGEIKTTMSDLQHIWGHHGKKRADKGLYRRRLAFPHRDSPSARCSFLRAQTVFV